MRDMHGLHSSVPVAVLLAAPIPVCSPACFGEQSVTAEPACVLGWPGVAERFVLFADGSVQAGSTGVAVSESIDLGREHKASDSSEATHSLGWTASGTRVVKVARDFEGLEFISLTAADMHGRPAPSLWLFRAIALTNPWREARSCRLAIRVAWDEGQHDLALRRGSVLTDSGRVLLVTSREADRLDVSADSHEALLTFDLNVPPKTTVEALIAVPSAPEVYDEADAPDMSRLEPSDVMARVASHWQQRVVPDTLTVGSPLVTHAFHAAVSGLILSPPGERARPTEKAAWMSALARARQGAVAADLVQSLVEQQRSGEGFTMAVDLIDHADLTTALADYARHADEPGRMCRLLWTTISGAATDVSTRAAETETGAMRARASLALREAANVADMIGQEPEAGAWRQQAAALAPEGTAAGAAAEVADPFSSRAYAAGLAARTTAAAPPPTDLDLSLVERLARAHVALLAGTQEDRLLAWQAVEDELRARPLPGAFMRGGTEDSLAAALLITLVCDAVCQSGADEVHLFPALPIGWDHDGLLLTLARFPSGIGSLDLRASVRRARMSVEPLVLPKSAADIMVHPLLGVETVSVGVNGRRLKQEAFDAGPPWKIDPKAQELVIRLGRQPSE